MADEDMMEMDDLGEDEEGEESSGGNPLMKYLPWIAILLVVQVVLAYFVAQWFFVPDELPEGAQVEEVAPAEGEQGEGGEGEGDPGYEPPPSVVAVIYTQVPTIVVNPKGTEGLRFLSAEVHLGLSSQAVVEHIDGTNKLSRINDTLIRLFTTKTIADVDPSRHEQLKEDI
ncbi:MAG: flagellar basal body-associated FliL family protein, partial [Candidatus Latescibacteria bacterium]|nr:flagellar basal body-associated FliL family protein [Candidatus Latescibacterota bacterium]